MVFGKRALHGLSLILAFGGIALACSDGDDSDSSNRGGAAGETSNAGRGGGNLSGSGGRASGGAGGNQSTGGQGGTQGPKGGSGGSSAGETGQGGSANGGAQQGGSGGSAGSGKSLDECFAGLRAGEGDFQDATKTSADKRYKMRLALETGDRFGTSGTKPWEPLRFALETPDGNVCITDEAVLATAYKTSRHNCGDVLTITAGGRRYVIDNPDTAIDLGDPNSWNRPATLKIFVGEAQQGSSIRLDTSACNKSSRDDGRCASGGPC